MLLNIRNTKIQGKFEINRITEPLTLFTLNFFFQSLNIYRTPILDQVLRGGVEDTAGKEGDKNPCPLRAYLQYF